MMKSSTSCQVFPKPQIGSSSPVKMRALVSNSVDKLSVMKEESEHLLKNWLKRKMKQLIEEAVVCFKKTQLSREKQIPSILNDYDEVVVLFGGQGYKTLKELRSVSKTKGMFQMVKKTSRMLELQYAFLEMNFPSSYWKFAFGYSVFDWITGEKSEPESWYLYSAVIAYPLTLLSQFLKYIEFLVLHGMDHSDFVPFLSRMSGHSQGIISSVILSVSSNTNELISAFCSFLRLSVYQGFRAHNCLVKNLGSDDFVSKIETVSPMLSLSGWTRDELNNSLLNYSGIQVVIENDEKLFVVAGDPSILQSYQKSLPKGISSVFIKTGGAYHTKLYDFILPTLVNDASVIGLSISPSDLKIPVFCTEKGDSMGLEKTDIIPKLLSLQMKDFLNFSLVINNLVNKNKNTLVLDFGPGAGASNISRTILLRKNAKFTVLCFADSLRKIRYKDGTFTGSDILNRYLTS